MSSFYWKPNLNKSKSYWLSLLDSTFSKIKEKKKDWKDRIDDIMMSIGKDFYRILQLTSLNQKMDEEEYWGINYYFIRDLSLIFGIGISEDGYFLI